MTRTTRTIVSTALGAVALVATALPAAAHDHALTNPARCIVMPNLHLANGHEPIHSGLHTAQRDRARSERVSVAGNPDLSELCA